MAGSIFSVNGNVVSARADCGVMQNSVAVCCRRDGARLLGEVIRVRGAVVDIQVFEETRGVCVGDPVEFQEELLSVALAPGLLGQVFDGLQTPLTTLAEQAGFFLQPGTMIPPLNKERQWAFSPSVEPGAVVRAGQEIGSVTEGIFTHQIMVPFDMHHAWTVETILPAGEYTIDESIAEVRRDGEQRSLTMVQRWPVRVPLNISRRRLLPQDSLVTGIRIIDAMFPVAHGGTYCVPGPFGAGKTVLQQLTARYAEVDVVVIVACGERAGEVVEVLHEFPALTDPRTGRSLMERTIIICNTSAMPVSAREASIYTGVTLGEYYRQMGLKVLLLADSTSRWAQALREISGRLEEIPGEEAFPAYLESRIAAFYERAGIIELFDGRIGSLTIGGTVSPAGGNFEEPVTQGTLKVVGAFHGLSRARSEARRYPAIDPLDSWSKYKGVIGKSEREKLYRILQRGRQIEDMMNVVGEEGTSMEDFSILLKAGLIDRCFLQQNAFDPVDASTAPDRQRLVVSKLLGMVDLDFCFKDKDTAREKMFQLRDLFLNWNTAAEGSAEFADWLSQVDAFCAEEGKGAAL